MTEEVKIEVIQPFANLIYKITMPESVTQGLIEHTDKMREDPNTPSFGESLVGQVDEELEIDISKLQPIIPNFLLNCSREWLYNQLKQGFGWEPSWNLKKEDTQRMNTVLYSLLESIRQIGILIQPIMPYSSNKILDQMDLMRLS